MTNPTSQFWFVFNELSVRSKAESQHEGHKRLDGMVHAVARVMGGRPAELVSIGHRSLWEAELAVGYTVADWCARAEPELRQLFLGIALKTDFPEEVDSALRDRFHLSEFQLPEESGPNVATEARGLGAAYLLRGIGVSLLTEPQWEQTRIALRHLWLNDECQTREDTVEVLNLSDLSQAEGVSQIVVQRRQETLVNDPLDLAARKGACFPHLSFGSEVDRHLEDLPSAVLPLLIRKLIVLDNACREWRQDDTMFLPQLSDCRAESGPTMQQYGDRRIFSDPQGQEQVYELHVAFGSYRIHLRILHQPQRIEIGYVGRHLPTVKYPNR